jgi:cytoskeletal protein CcmA (bactofilin family)
VESRNGAVLIDRGTRVGSGVVTRNGEIRLRPGAVVEGNVVSRNGRVRLEEARVGGNVDVVHGDIHLSGGSQVDGDVVLLMRDDHGFADWIWPFNRWFAQDPPVIRIDAGARIGGRLIVDERARIEIAPGADVPQPIRYPNREAWLGN